MMIHTPACRFVYTGQRNEIETTLGRGGFICFALYVSFPLRFVFLLIGYFSTDFWGVAMVVYEDAGGQVASMKIRKKQPPESRRRLFPLTAFVASGLNHCMCWKLQF